MTSRHTTDDLDPVLAAELAALEAALNDAPGADPVLTALVRDVRAETPPMPLSLKTRLDEQVAAGFPRSRRRLGLPALPHGRLLPAMGIAATMLIAVVVTGGALTSSGGDSSSSTLALSTPNTEATASAPAGSGTIATDEALVPKSAANAAPAEPEAARDLSSPNAPAAAPSAQAVAGGTAVSPSGRAGLTRKVERAVQLQLRVGGAELEDTADGVVRATQGAGGYVSDSSVSRAGRGGSATFTLRIPTARLDATIAKLSKLGHVAAMDQSSRDITSSFVSAADRLSDARAERKALLKALAKADTAGQIASLRNRLRINRSDIALLKGQLDALRRRADVSTVDVTIEARGGAVAVPAKKGDGGRWGPGDAARDALRVLEVAAGVALVAAAAVLPVGVLGALAWSGASVMRRRRRESALDAG